MRTAILVSLVVCVTVSGPCPAAGKTSAVRADSLEAMVRFLSVDPATHAFRSRFVFREHAIGLVADSLVARLGRYTGHSVDRVPFLIHDHLYSKAAPNDSTYPAENIVARLVGTGAVPGVVLVTAHYDAIAARMDSFPQKWRTLSAPGADDNATGVAAVMELARTLPRG
ncbi:MAG TPA: M28 family peptidase, partial [Candidatus Bathyarchaeia archaeon]|nr:M28 family peptidase [Candidatus Bathyarchaeia archaeon]